MKTVNVKSVARTLSSSTEVEMRHKQLHLPHMEKLHPYLDELRSCDVGDVPNIDPFDGGTNAKMLFLLEKPGRKAFKSGFISRDNNDSTAEAILKFMVQAQIPRSEVMLWNVIPAWNGTTKITAAELKFGMSCLNKLIEHLPRLRSIVFVGRKAQRAIPLFTDRGIALYLSFHPSPKNYALARDKWESIPSKWAEAWNASR